MERTMIKDIFKNPQEYADKIGADAYAKDAADTVRVVERLLRN